LEAAKSFGREWYMAKQAEVSRGFAPTRKTKTFAHMAQKALGEYEDDAKRGKRSDQYIRGLRNPIKVINRTCIANVDIAEVNQQVWNEVQKDLLKFNPKMSERTLHQYRNIINITLKQALKRGELKQLPQFVREPTGAANATPRTWFDPTEYKALKTALKDHIAAHKAKKTRWVTDAEELYDYVLFLTNTGLRVDEGMNVRFCDVTIVPEGKREYLEIRNIKGKRGLTGQCKSFYGAPYPFKRCIARQKLTLENFNASDAKIFKHYHRDMFRDILKAAKLYQTSSRVPLKRDLKSMRNTYICMRLLQGAPVYDIAANCRTSVQMIQNHYARHLSVLKSKTINLNKWGTSEEEA
jgi:hypothetical protein